MTTTFSSLPIVSLAALSNPTQATPKQLSALSKQLDEVFSTTGFAYLTDLPLTYDHAAVFGLCEEFFGGKENKGGCGGVSEVEKQRLLKRTFNSGNGNTYRGYFPPQPGSDNFKEGFEIGSPTPAAPLSTSFPAKFNLTEANIWPRDIPTATHFRHAMENFYTELQDLAARLLSLLATALGQEAGFFDHYLTDSLSTLRLIHYPPLPPSRSASASPDPATSSDLENEKGSKMAQAKATAKEQELICTPHTDSGILTILHQDTTGGLEVLNAAGEWISAPYVPASVVVNIGDLMAEVSAGRWVATMHRVRRTAAGDVSGGDMKKGRYSVPFFFEPGAECVVKSVASSSAGTVAGKEEEKDRRGVVYGEHLLKKMAGWIEFQDVDVDEENLVGVPSAIDAGLETGGSLVAAF